MDKRIAPAIELRVIIAVLAHITGGGLAVSQETQADIKKKQTDKPAIVFLVAGQSNAGGCGVLSPELHEKLQRHESRPLVPGSTARGVRLSTDAADYTHSYIWVPGRGFQRINPDTNLRPANPDAQMHGMELPVIAELERRFPGNDMFVIKHGPGATNLHHDWNPQRTDGQYSVWLGCYRKAMAQLSKEYPKVRVVGLYWDQGESDGKDNMAGEYEKNLTNFIADLRRDTGIPKLKIFIRKHIFNWPNIDTVIEAQEKVVESDPRCYLLDIDLGNRKENYEAWAYSPGNGHVSSKGFVELTKRLFDGPLRTTCMPSMTGVHTAAADGEVGVLTPSQQERWRETLASFDYVAIARAYADFMIEHGCDVYGDKHTPLFVTGMNRKTGEMLSPPFAHVKRKPFMPGWERDRELRDHDRNYGQADPLDQLTLLKLMHRLTQITGDQRYAEEANKACTWWMANAQSPIGLYPWGTHTYWKVDTDSGAGRFEFNHVWPYWDLNPESLHKFAMGLWNHYVADKETGNFNRHAHSHQHRPSGDKEFPWPGSAMIATWVEAYLDKPNPEYLRAINTILNRWESLRDDNGHLAACSSYGEWAWYLGYMQAANRLDDWADRIEAKQHELAERMRDYGRKNDKAYLSVSDNLLDIKTVGPVKSYVRATGSYNPERLDIIGGPWQDRKDYAGFALMLNERMKRNSSSALQARYRKAVLDTAEVYMSINPEVQWSVWGANMANAIRLMLAAHDHTGNAAYLHRADHFGQLAVELFLDDASPLPKITSHDDYYEIESVTTPSSDVWMLAVLELRHRLANVAEQDRHTVRIATTGGNWDCTKLAAPASSISLSYGENGERALFLSRREKGFAPNNGLSIDGLELISSDHVNTLPTLEEVKPFNGIYRRRFAGKHREPSTAIYGGFKDVLDHASLWLANHGKENARVVVTATYHDSWDDRESEEHYHTLLPGERVRVNCTAPAKRFIRRLDFSSNVPEAVKLETLTFAMKARNENLSPSSD